MASGFTSHSLWSLRRLMPLPFIVLASAAATPVQAGRPAGCTIGPRASCFGADLSGRDLRSADLSGADLRGADLRGVVMLWGSLRQARLQGAL